MAALDLSMVFRLLGTFEKAAFRITFAWHLSNLTSDSASGTLILQAREMESPHCVHSHAQPSQTAVRDSLSIFALQSGAKTRSVEFQVGKL